MPTTMDTAGPISHDQNFKNLIFDYPLQALQLFAPQEAEHLDASVRFTPIREEQLKDRLSGSWPSTPARYAVCSVWNRTRINNSTTWTSSTSTPG